LPSELLERRPDIARAERALAASNARIGVAQAAFFPTLRLTGYGGFESKEVTNLFDLSSNVWSIAPSLSLPIFQGFRNEQNLRLERAAFDASVAGYRQSVLVAFKEVQDALTATRLLTEQSQAIRRSELAAQRASELARKRFDAGFTGYIDVIDSERTALVVSRAAAQIEGLRFVAAVSLIKALGGGWDSTSLPALAGSTSSGE
jgi:multidrug efflux system outer membrane protein